MLGFREQSLARKSEVGVGGRFSMFKELHEISLVAGAAEEDADAVCILKIMVPMLSGGEHDSKNPRHDEQVWMSWKVGAFFRPPEVLHSPATWELRNPVILPVIAWMLRPLSSQFGGSCLPGQGLLARMVSFRLMRVRAELGLPLLRGKPSLAG